MIKENGRFWVKENNDGSFSYSDERGNLVGSYDTIYEAWDAVEEAKTLYDQHLDFNEND